jgi:hypothetical protein
MQTKNQLHLFWKSYTCFTISSVFKEENLLNQVGRLTDACGRQGYALRPTTTTGIFEKRPHHM